MPPVGIISGGEKVKTVLLGCSGELPPEVGTTVELTEPPPATLPVMVADVKRSALPNEMVMLEVSIGAPLMFVMLTIPAFTVPPGDAVVVGAGDDDAIAEGVGVGVLAPVAVAVAVRVMLAVAVAVGVATLLEVDVAVAVNVAVMVGVAVRVGVAVAVAVPVVAVAVGVAIGHATNVTFPHSNPCTSNPVGPPELPRLMSRVFIAPAEVGTFIIDGVFKVGS
jgi:hypothetical protein